MEEALKRVLITDDEEDMREYIREILIDEGFEIHTACNGDEAIELASQMKFDLITLDVQMPVKDGLLTLKELSQIPLAAGTPVIMITGVGGTLGVSMSKEMIGDTFGAEPAAFLDKPIIPQQLLSAIESILGG